ncbi:MAG: efflux RND transporter permease subunit, partial [Verrucomicrobiota bacterium]
MSLPAFSVKHSIFGNMLTLFVFVGGFIMMTVIQRDTFPELNLDTVTITTAWPNASPEEIEDLVTNPIEEALRDVENIEEFTSSSVEGISAINVKIEPDARFKDRIVNQIQRKVDQVNNLPADAEESEIELIESREPVIDLCVSGDVAEKVLRDYGDHLKERIQEIEGVSTVVKNGWRDEEFWVEVDPEALETLELAITEVTDSLARRNVNRPGGKLLRGDREIVLRTVGQFHTAEEIEEVIVRSNADGQHIRIKDVATVCRTYEEDSLYTRVNGKRAVVLVVKQTVSGDSIKIVDEVRDLVDEERAFAPEGISLDLVDDEAYYVKRRLNILSSNGVIGFVMVILILFLFLNFRVAIITGIGIPFAILASLMLMALFGVKVDLITMFGLIIVLGMLVDDAIIVGENIFRHLEMGKSPAAAAVAGTEEVMFPVLSTVLTTIAAFTPLVLAPDIFGQVLRWFPIVISITLVASLFEVLFIMPCHAVEFV